MSGCYRTFCIVTKACVYTTTGRRWPEKTFFQLSRGIMRLNNFIFIKHVTKVLCGCKIRDPWTSDLILRDENNPAQTPLGFFQRRVCLVRSSAQQFNDFVRWAVGPWSRILDLKYKYFKCKREYLGLNVVFEDKGQRDKETKKEKGSY